MMGMLARNLIAGFDYGEVARRRYGRGLRRDGARLRAPLETYFIRNTLATMKYGANTVDPIRPARGIRGTSPRNSIGTNRIPWRSHEITRGCHEFLGMLPRNSTRKARWSLNDIGMN
jgi:hypothetical protein